MDLELDTSDEMASPGHSHKWNLRVAVITLLTTGVALFTVTWLALHPSGGHTGITTPPGVVFPVGTLNALQPSGYSPPGPHALRGYHLNYSNDFSGTKVPSGWYLFDGVPGGLPGAQFSSAHVVVKNGVLQLNTWRDPRFHLKWVTGGLCQCGFPQTYEAYFVRSRITGAGPNEVQLLWPASNTWPPEIDFNETGARSDSTSSTVHWGVINHTEQLTLNINMTRWHTWGVIWSPRAIIYTVDGRVWGSITTPIEIPRGPMRIDFEQRAGCQVHRDCPTAPESMLVDWVAEYAPNRPVG